MTEKSLKSCPFCGGQADIMRFGKKDKSGIVSCSACGAKIAKPILEWAIEAWNERE